MIAKTIPSTWIREDEHRLDCGPFTRGSIETRKRIEHFPGSKDRLASLTRNGIAGMYHVGQDKLRFVESAEYGVPFLGSADIMKADLSNQPYISKDQVAGNPLFQCPGGISLITRCGTIGRMVYCRRDMAEMAISQDVLKVVADTEKIPSGYLYAFLSSKYGLPMVVGGTFGSIIVHIEAANIADLPVPRLGEAVEQRAHALVEEAAQSRSRASLLFTTALRELEQAAELSPLATQPSSAPFEVSIVPSTSINERFDAFFHSRYHSEVTLTLRESGCPVAYVKDFAKTIIEPLRFKRIPVENTEFGIPFFGTSAMMWIGPQPTYHLPRRMVGISNYLVDECTVLVPRSGQLNGVIGTAVLPIGSLIGGAISEDAIRVICRSVHDAGYLSIALRSDFGLRQIKARAFGSSIPHLNVDQVIKVLIPFLDSNARLEIGEKGSQVAALRNKAILLESEATKLVERTIEGAV